MPVKLRLEITTIVEIPFDAAQYPEGSGMADALAVELERASRDPTALSRIRGATIEIQGVVVDDNPMEAPDPFSIH